MTKTSNKAAPAAQIPQKPASKASGASKKATKPESAAKGAKSGSTGSTSPKAASSKPEAAAKPSSAKSAKAPPPAAKAAKPAPKPTPASAKKPEPAAAAKKAAPAAPKKAEPAAKPSAAKGKTAPAKQEQKTASRPAALEKPAPSRAKTAPPAVTPEPPPQAESKSTAKGQRPLEGLVVLDLTTRLAGPAATQILANFGAEVIKIEPPAAGDEARYLEPEIHGVGASFALINRGKKSLALDLENERGQEAFLALAQKADIVVEAFQPDRMEALGIGYSKLKTVNPGLLYVALTGYGQVGPYATTAGRDINYLSVGGALDLMGGDSEPHVPGLQVAEIAAGSLPTVIGVLLALEARNRTGRGQLVDVAMLDGVVGLLTTPFANYSATRRKPQRGKERLFGQYACYNIYPVRNGRWLSVGALEPAHWATLCRALEREDLIPEQFADGDRQPVVIAELTRIFQRKEVREWMEIFQGQDVCVTEVRDISDAAHDEHLIAREMVVPVKHAEGGSYPFIGVYPKLTDTPGVLGGEAPRHGEHSRELLKRFGVPAARINELLEEGVVRQAEDETQRVNAK